MLLVGTGTSWHAAHQGAAFLRRAGLEAWGVQAADAALDDPFPKAGDALVLLSHRGWKWMTSDVLARARERGVETVVVAGDGVGADVHTSPQEVSATFTASHLGALLRLAQLAEHLGADLGSLADVRARWPRSSTATRPRSRCRSASCSSPAWASTRGRPPRVR